MAATVSGTIAPVGPVDFPINSKVSGIKNTSKMINGIDLIVLTIKSTVL